MIQPEPPVVCNSICTRSSFSGHMDRVLDLCKIPRIEVFHAISKLGKPIISENVPVVLFSDSENSFHPNTPFGIGWNSAPSFFPPFIFSFHFSFFFTFVSLLLCLIITSIDRDIKIFDNWSHWPYVCWYYCLLYTTFGIRYVCFIFQPFITHKV